MIKWWNEVMEWSDDIASLHHFITCFSKVPSGQPGIKIFRVFSDFRVFPNFQDYSWDQSKFEEKPFHVGRGCGQICTCVKPSSSQILTVAEVSSAFQSFWQKPVLIPVLVWSGLFMVRARPRFSGVNNQINLGGYLYLTGSDISTAIWKLLCIVNLSLFNGVELTAHCIFPQSRQYAFLGFCKE